MKIPLNLKWIVVLRHAEPGERDIPTQASFDYIRKVLNKSICEKFGPTTTKTVVFTSQETRAVITGNYISRYLIVPKTISMKQLSCSEYGDGSRNLTFVMENVDDEIEVIIIVGHHYAVSGTASAILQLYNSKIDPYLPENLEGVVINAQTGEFTIGIKKFFGIT